MHSGHAAVVQNDLNLTAAANKLATTQPAVSKQFKSLEGELGFRIFTRRGRAFTKVKPAGERIVMYANSACIRALPSGSPKWASWGGFARDGLLRQYRYDFLQLLAPHLTRRLIARAAVCDTQQAVEALLPT